MCRKIAGHKNLKPIDKTSIPGCTYCRPQVASIGMTDTSEIEISILKLEISIHR